MESINAGSMEEELREVKEVVSTEEEEGEKSVMVKEEKEVQKVEESEKNDLVKILNFILSGDIQQFIYNCNDFIGIIFCRKMCFKFFHFSFIKPYTTASIAII